MGGLLARILILGGTLEGSAVARLIAGDARFDAVLSLAGRTSQPAAQPVRTRSGGFGGADGLARWLEAEGIAATIDATHPFAAQISANAVEACGRLGLPLATVIRPEWTRRPGDEWTEVDSPDAAAGFLATESAPRRVFLAVGRQELGSFATAPQHDYLARLIEPPAERPLPPQLRLLFARGPFDKAAEAALLADERIDMVVSKNSGGAATYGKIEAAREARLPVILIKRPEKRHGTVLHSPEEALAWLEALADHGRIAPSRRGV
jgi:precorrin-6A/cobalt-precorrin-6A reductase